ncbi:MAG: TIGR03564 family F420-dependent LLM class oxidoreductase [Acidimicrobiia bacterium]
MRIGIFGGDTAGRSLETVIADARDAESQGFASYCLPQIFAADALTTLALVGREVPRIELATGVVPTYPRHPMMLAQQALTVQAAIGGRLALGIGLSHQIVVENMFGYPFDQPARHLREYLSILGPLVRDGAVSFDGETLHAHGAVTVEGASPFPILVAALGPKLLGLAATLADGTVTWMTGPATLASHTIPTITAAAARAGRPAPRIACALPVCVTDDVDAARLRAAVEFEVYGMLPSYRAMLDREGAAGPADVAVVGDEATVRGAIEHLDEIGVTDFVASEFGSRADRERTRTLLASLV